MILSLAPDLMMRSKIDLAARHYQLEALHASDAAGFREALNRHGHALSLVLIDLDLEGVDTVPLVQESRESTEARVVGFCSHVMTDLIRAARAAGAHSVMPNSTFAAGIPGMLATIAAEQSKEQEPNP